MRDENDVKTAELLPADTAPKRGVGRPKQYESAAERQKAYRQRLKQQGKRVVSKIVRDVRDDTRHLVSDVLDLSEVRGARGI